jgi:ABC-type phosphate transport system substrate-binding protein
MTDQTRSISMLAVTLAALALCGAVTAAGTATVQSDRPTVQVVGNTVTADGTTTVGIVLTSAPDGLSGYYLDVTVENPEVARIEGASYPDRFALTSDPNVGDDGATVTLEAADMEGTIEPGAAEVTLATVQLSGISPGEAELTAEPRQFDADDGSAFRPATAAGAVTVTGSESEGATAPDSTPTNDDGAADAPGGGDATDADAGDGDGDGAAAATGDGTDAAETAGQGPLPTTLTLVALGAFAALGLLRRRRS